MVDNTRNGPVWAESSLRGGGGGDGGVLRSACTFRNRVVLADVGEGIDSNCNTRNGVRNPNDSSSS